MPRYRFIGRRQLLNIAAEPVDLALVLAMDCSGSISKAEVALQFLGYAQAISSDALIAAIQSGYHQRVALTFITWSDAKRQDQVVPWTLIHDKTTAGAFAASLSAASIPRPGYTSISGAIDFSRRVLGTCSYAAARRIIDVSGNGKNNDGRNVTAARDEAVAAHITINGLPIVSQEADIAAYYARNVIGGPAAFVSVSQSLASFQRASLRKLITEIAAA